MSNNKQSSNQVPDVRKMVNSVEWFSNQVYELFEQYSEGNFDRITLNKLVLKATEQAKAMHKEEHGQTWDAAMENMKARGGNDMRAWGDFDDYYAEKFRVNDEQAMIDYNAMEEESEMDNYKEMEDQHKPETATEWLREEITYDNGTGQRRGSFDEFVDLTHYFDQAQEMELVAKEASYALGYSEGYKRSLEMVEWYIKHHIKGDEQYK